MSRKGGKGGGSGSFVLRLLPLCVPTKNTGGEVHTEESLGTRLGRWWVHLKSEEWPFSLPLHEWKQSSGFVVTNLHRTNGCKHICVKFVVLRPKS